MIKIQKTVYDEQDPSDGKRILVMRLWPRGVSKSKVDLWMKELGTPVDLIKKWKARKIDWEEFAKGYLGSLDGKEEILKALAKESRGHTITLLCTEKDPQICHRSLLKDAIERQR